MHIFDAIFPVFDRLGRGLPLFADPEIVFTGMFYWLFSNMVSGIFS